MRSVIVIPHYSGPPTAAIAGRHASTSLDRERQGAKLRATVLSLHQALGTRQSLLQICERRAASANDSLSTELRVAVCTTGDHHALAEAGLPSHLYEHSPCDASPEWLGFACREVLRREAAQADWFGYLEDDLLLADPLWWVKLSWFIEGAGADAVLQPNRFERGAGLSHRCYVDGRLRADVAGRFQDRSDRPVVELEGMGRRWRFVRPSNPHGGCYFLRADQLARWMAAPDFATRGGEFVGPLESAATLGLMRNFRVYKPHRDHAGFLELEHQSNQFISLLRARPAGE